jgi:FtsP/CotA-like multicopper oxidase with cupredoxin domain
MKCNAFNSFGRRAFLQLSGLATFGACLEPLGVAASPAGSPDPTHVLRIRKAQVELAPGHLITTTTYDGQLPGPLLRTAVGEPVRVDVYNETDIPERINWHGQAVEERASLIAARSVRRMEFTPQHPGLHFYHSDLIAAGSLDAGLYSGQAGALLVEPRSRRGAAERECVIMLKSCEPFLLRTRRGCEVSYASFTINGRIPDRGAPALFQANSGETVLLHVLNASATESHTLGLAGHSFEVTALDGNLLRCPVRVPALHLNPGESASARVKVHHPTGWVVQHGPDATWNYLHFGRGNIASPDETLDIVLTRHEAARSGFNRWDINGTSFTTRDPRPLFRAREGLRYRLRIHNTSDEVIPLSLQRHRLEIAAIDGTASAGVLKDVVAVGPQQRVEVDFVADFRGPALLHSTRQWHRDFGLMALIGRA